MSPPTVSNKLYLIRAIDFSIEETDLAINHNEKMTEIGLELRLLKTAVDEADFDFDDDRWFTFFGQYGNLNKKKAEFLNEGSTLTREYESMLEFWEDAKQQKRGNSRHTFWDTYEHGRRRQIEILLAKMYGCEESILMNAGMSAIQIAIESTILKAEEVILTTKRGFFETTEYLQKFVEPRGVQIMRVDPDEITSALAKYKPKLLVTETVINIPQAECMKNFTDWKNASPNTVLIIDNTVQSHLTRLFQKEYCLTDRLLVVESGTKYFTEDISVGVLYGAGELINEARDYARGIGQQLQEKCFNYLSEGTLKSLDLKLQLHSRNVDEFTEIIKKDYLNLFEFYRTLNHEDPESRLFCGGQGSLIYFKVNLPGSEDKVNPQRRVLIAWKDLARERGVKFQIRAGFGWSRTMARVYESSFLNQADSPNYVRVSIGMEPKNYIRVLAQALGDSILRLNQQGVIDK